MSIDDESLKQLRERAERAIHNKKSYGYTIGAFTHYLQITNITLTPEILLELLDEIERLKMHE